MEAAILPTPLEMIGAILSRRSARISLVKIFKLTPALFLLLGVAASPLRAQDDSNKSLGEKTVDTTKHETHKVANTTRHVTHKVANTTRHETHKVANTTRHETHKVANTTRHVTSKKSDASNDSAQRTNNTATPQ